MQEFDNWLPIRKLGPIQSLTNTINSEKTEKMKRLHLTLLLTNSGQRYL